MPRHKREAGQALGQKTGQKTLQASGQGHAGLCPTPLRLLVAANIAVCRKKSGLTQSQTGRSLGLEKETISRIEGGKISVSVDRLEEFADLVCLPRRNAGTAIRIFCAVSMPHIINRY